VVLKDYIIIRKNSGYIEPEKIAAILGRIPDPILESVSTRFAQSARQIYDRAQLGRPRIAGIDCFPESGLPEDDPSLSREQAFQLQRELNEVRDVDRRRYHYYPEKEFYEDHRKAQRERWDRMQRRWYETHIEVPLIGWVRKWW